MATYTGGKNRDNTFLGTDRADIFVFDPADLTGADLIFGGDGDALDTLRFTAAGAIEAAALASVIGIERIELSGLGNSITLVRSLLETAAQHSLTVQGGAGADRINALGIVNAPDDDGGSFEIKGGGGDDILIGGDDDRLVLDGEDGSDTIFVTRGRAVYDPLDQRITALGDGATLAIGTGMTLDLTRTADQSDWDRAVVTGFRNADASSSSEAVVLIGGEQSVLTGGSGADKITGGLLVRGGLGRDTILGGTGTGAHLFAVGDGEFARGEAITGRSGQDVLIVSGQADFRIGKLAGIEAFQVEAIANGTTNVSLFTSQLGAAVLTLVAPPDAAVSVNLYLDDRSSLSVNLTAAVAVFATAGSDIIDAGSASVFAGGGDDQVALSYFSNAKVLDGGSGQDTLVIGSYRSATYDLGSAVDQDTTSIVTVRGFENIDLSRATASTVYGSKAGNHIVGSSGADVIDGKAGNDTIVGGGNADLLTGGGGCDTFVWLGRGGIAPTITDFSRRDDGLQFDRDAFQVPGGEIDTRVVSKGGAVDLRGIDLLVYKGEPITYASEITAILSSAQRGPDGVFVALENYEHDVLLIYAPAGSGTGYETVGVFGGGIDPLDFTVANMILA